MVFWNTFSSRSTLSPRQALKLANNICLDNARQAKDSEVALQLCDDAEVALSHVKRASKAPSVRLDDQQTLFKEIADVYIGLGKLQDGLGQSDKAQANYKRAELWGPPEPDERLNDTPQLACCLGILRASQSPDIILEPLARDWLQAVEKNTDEQERLKRLARDVIRAFKGEEIKDSKAVAEVIHLAPVLERDDFRYLLKEFYSGVDQSDLLNVHQLGGLADLITGANPGYLDADDLVKILELLSMRLRNTHQQSPQYIYRLTQTVSRVLDAMADTRVKGLDQEKLHEPLSLYLNGLKGSSDPYLAYQAAYAYQALQYVPDNETLWQATLRRTGRVIQGVSGLVSAAKGMDLNEFIDGIRSIQQGLTGASETVKLIRAAIDGATSLTESGQDFFDCLKEGLSFTRK
ncbi:hypothetical protein BGX34_006884, partial [Mortierella sp. NVP85]